MIYKKMINWIFLHIYRRRDWLNENNEVATNKFDDNDWDSFKRLSRLSFFLKFPLRPYLWK